MPETADQGARLPAGSTPATNPGPAPDGPAAAGGGDLAERLLGAFEGRVPPVPVPLFYRAGLLLVAVAMVLLPLIYLAVIALTGWLLFLHVIHIPAIFETVRGRGALLVALGPPAVGGVLLLFMVKPLFAPRGKERRPKALSRAAEPLLFAFVERLCRAVGAPAPRAILVDHEVNASASFRRGALSMFGSDLQLCIGLPLAGGLGLRQFAGVLAHEFGHFAQAGGMRLTYVIRSIDGWFARVVYERDSWDERLVRWSKEFDLRIGVVFYLARALVWLTRRLLWLLMWTGHLISCFMLRQMEFDADRYEAALAGSGNFAEVARRLPLLAVAAAKTQSELSASWQEGRLADDYPGMVVLNADRIPPDVRAQVEKEAAGRRTGFFDTHPSDAERIASAGRLGAPGIFRPDGELPATALFAGFRELCRALSLELYRAVFGPKVRSEALVPFGELERRQKAEEEAAAALGRFFRGKMSPLRSIGLPAGLPPPADEPEEVGAELRAARRRMVEALPGYASAFDRWDDLDTRLVQAAQAGALIDANFRIEPKDFRLTGAGKAAVQVAEKALRAEVAGLAPALASLETDAARRLVAALRLLGEASVAERIPTAPELLAEARRILPAAALLAGLTPRAVELRDRLEVIVLLARNLEGNQGNAALISGLRAKLRSLEAKLRALQDALGAAPYPLDHADRNMTLRGFVVPKVPRNEELGEMVEAGGEALNRFFTLSARLTARLAFIAETVEDALGLPRLPEPRKEEAGEPEAG